MSVLAFSEFAQYSANDLSPVRFAQPIAKAARPATKAIFMNFIKKSPFW
jgi:hypothetical protein